MGKRGSKAMRSRSTSLVIAITVLGFLEILVARPSDAQAPSPSLSQHVGIPAYFPPSASYNQEEPWGPTFAGTPAASTGQYDTVSTAGGFVIANVINGPDYAADINYDYSGTLLAEHRSGTKVIGYVDTGYFGTTGLKTRAGYSDTESWRDQIEQDVNAWYAFYGASMDGIFFDEGQNSCGPSNSWADLYAQVSTYVKDAHPGALTVVNPGITVPSCYQNAADTIVTFEGPESAYTAATVALDWSPGDPNKIMHIVYGVPAGDLAAVLAQSKQWGAGYIDITDEGGTGNPPLYRTLPSYLATELQGAAGAGTSVAPPAPSGLDTFDVQFTSAQLNWEGSSSRGGVVVPLTYEVYLKHGTEEFHWVSNTPLADWRSPNVFLTGLIPGDTYSAYLRARNTAGDLSAPTATISWTQEVDRSQVGPATPLSPTSSQTTYSTTVLTWSAQDDTTSRANPEYPTVSFRVFEDGAQVLQVPATARRATVTGIAPGTSHSFVVYAVDAAGHVSSGTDPLTVTTFAFEGSSVASTGQESLTAQELTLAARVYLPYSFVRAFIDTDNDATTGYEYNGIGADYVVENGRLFRLATGPKFAPSLLGQAVAVTADYVSTWRIPLGQLPGSGQTVQVVYQAEGFAPLAVTPPLAIPATSG
ncbi:MAG: hypothetical protein JWM76_2407 [Pseudonocardiales bacterium]|nr:hypothetical protein [Pseudonocardiales bacterium]